jgi:hypothetical protein
MIDNMLTAKTLEDALKEINGKRIYSGASLLSVGVDGVVQYVFYDLNSLTEEQALELVENTSTIQPGTIIYFQTVQEIQSELFITRLSFSSPGVLSLESGSWDDYQDSFVYNRFSDDLQNNLQQSYIFSNVNAADIVGDWIFADLKNIANNYKYISYTWSNGTGFSFIGGTTQSRTPPRNKPFEFETRADYSLRDSVFSSIKNEIDARYAGSTVRIRTFATGLAEADTFAQLSMNSSSYPSITYSGSIGIRMTLAENVRINNKLHQLSLKIVKFVVGEKIPWNSSETASVIDVEILITGSRPLVSSQLLLQGKSIFTEIPDKQPWPQNPDCITGTCQNINQESYSYRPESAITEVVKFW